MAMIVFDGERINGTNPTIVRHGIFRDGRPPHLDTQRRTCPALTRSDPGVKHDIDMVFDYFPRLRERTGPAGYSGGEQQMLAIDKKLMARLRPIRECSMASASQKDISNHQAVDATIYTILLVEQNARCRSVATYGYIMEQGKINGRRCSSRKMKMKEFYLGPWCDRKSSAI